MSHSCANCATKLDEGCFICPHCGTVAGPSPAFAGPAAPALPGRRQAGHLKGIGGWLILVAAGLVLAPFGYLYTIATEYPLLTGESQGSPFLHSPFGNLVEIEIGVNAVFIAAVLGLNVLFFARKRAFPAWMMVYLVAQLCAAVTLYLAVVVVVPSVDAASILTQLVRPLLTALVWIPYLRMSKRVKATFVNP